MPDPQLSVLSHFHEGVHKTNKKINEDTTLQLTVQHFRTNKCITSCEDHLAG